MSPLIAPRSAALLCLIAACAAPFANAADAVRGRQLYESRCIGCHSLDANRIGPMHAGLFGRKAGSVADYEYSAALKASSIVWTQTTLQAWLENPQALIPGQKMGYSVPDAADRADLIEYLKAATRE